MGAFKKYIKLTYLQYVCKTNLNSNIYLIKF